MRRLCPPFTHTHPLIHFFVSFGSFFSLLRSSLPLSPCATPSISSNESNVVLCVVASSVNHPNERDLFPCGMELLRRVCSCDPHCCAPPLPVVTLLVILSSVVLLLPLLLLLQCTPPRSCLFGAEPSIPRRTLPPLFLCFAFCLLFCALGQFCTRFLELKHPPLFDFSLFIRCRIPH